MNPDTNHIVQVAQAAPVIIQSTFNAWHLVALGVGALVMHVYHVIVNAGGVRTILAKFMGPKGGVK